MDPLSVLGALIAVLQISGKVISQCYEYRKTVRSAPRDLARILDEVGGLRNVMERLIRLVDEDAASGRGYLPTVEQMTLKNGPLEHCQSDLQSIESRLERPLGKWKALGKQLIWPLEEKDVLKSLETVRRTKSLIESALAIDNSVSIIAIRETTRDLYERVLDWQRPKVLSVDTQKNVMLDWLGAMDQSSRFKFAIEKRHEKTGSWLLSRDQYENWRSTPGSLWVHGIPGCGKTVLCSTIIEDVTRVREIMDNAAVAYYYFDFGNKIHGTVDALLRSLLSQLLVQAENIPKRLGSLAQGHFSTTRYGSRPGAKHTTGPRPSGVSQPSFSELLNVFQNAIEQFSDTFIIIDAPDESVELDEILDFIEIALSWESPSLHLLVTSQDRREIQEALVPIINSTLLIEKTSIHEDIVTLIRSTLEGDRKLRKWSQVIKDEILATLVEGSQGMFQWVAVQLRALRGCLTPRDIKKTLNTLPKTLDATYSRILENLTESHLKHAITILKLLALSHHSVQIQEASEFIAFDFDAEDGPRFDPELRLQEVEQILVVTSGLVSMETVVLKREDGSVKEITRELHLAHSSVKEFLLRYAPAIPSRTLFGPTASDDWNALFCQFCLVYLNQLPGELNIETLPEFPGAHYVAQNWIFFAQSSSSEYRSIIGKLACRLLFSSTDAYCNWIRLYDHDMPWKNVDLNRKVFPSPIYFASVAGLEDSVEGLLEVGGDPNVAGGVFGSSLEAAIHYNQIEVARLLISAGADPNATKSYYGGPLLAAAAKNREDMVKLLLEKGAEPNSQRLSYNNSLLEACVRGQSGIVKLLIEAGANPNRYHEKAGGNPVATATRKNHPDIVALLLPKSENQTILGGLHAVTKENATEMLNIYAKFVPDSTLFYAADMGHQDLVTELLSNGASNLSIINKRYMRESTEASALVAAAVNGYDSIVRQLIDSGADVNASGDVGPGFAGADFALGGAAEAGHFEIVEVLLDNKADVHAVAHRGDALQRAAYRGHAAIVNLLVNHGADVNQPDGLFGGALQGAVLGRHMTLVRTFIGMGAHVDLHKGKSTFGTSEVKDCCTPLEAAVAMDDIEMVQYLLANGAQEVNRGTRTTLLSTAASKGNEALLETLLNAGADVEGTKDLYLMPLYRAIAEQQLGSMKVLIEAGAQTKATRALNDYNELYLTGPEITPLTAAVYKGFEHGVSLLIEQQVDVNAMSTMSMRDPETPLHTAARQGHANVARLLLDNGADVDRQIVEGWTSLHLAARGQSIEVVRVLVDEYKANVFLTLENGSHAIHSAANADGSSDETRDIINTLIDAGADVDVRNGNGRTPLYFAAEDGNLSAVRTLLERGARMDIMEENNMTALDAAKMKLAAQPYYMVELSNRMQQVLDELEKKTKATTEISDGHTDDSSEDS